MYIPLQYTHMPNIGSFDIVLGFMAILIILIIGYNHKSKKLKTPGNEHYKYYMPNIYFKLFFALLYTGIYIFYYGGGDTAAYWSGAAKLNNLFWESPTDYWLELTQEPTVEHMYQRYNMKTGLPPSWIYRDQNSFFVSKVLSIAMLFLGQSYILLTLLLAYITSIATWKLFQLVSRLEVASLRMTAISFLFIPSVAFWCAGISKDTLVFISTIYITYLIFQFLNKNIKHRVTSILTIFILFLILAHTRNFMIAVILFPLGTALTTRMLKAHRGNTMILVALRFIILVVGTGLFFLSTRFYGDTLSTTADKYLSEATVQQQDFQNNHTYGGKRYNLGITDFSPAGIISSAPRAIFAAIYLPSLLDAQSPLLLLSGLETALFTYLTLIFLFKGNVFKKIQMIRTNEFLIFCVFLVLILAFFTGFTSILFGVLVRMKAPFLPFLLILLTSTNIPKSSKGDQPLKDENLSIRSGKTPQ